MTWTMMSSNLMMTLKSTIKSWELLMKEMRLRRMNNFTKRQRKWQLKRNRKRKKKLSQAKRVS